MDYLTTAINLLGLAALFLYQRYRMKLLSETLAEQGNLLQETKNVVSQQATAISSQSTVVDAAIKYSQAFSPERIEQMVRREMEVDHKSEKADLEDKIRKLSESSGGASKEQVVAIGTKIAERISELFTPVMSRYAIHLLSLPFDKQQSEIESIEIEETRELVKNIVGKGNEMLEAAKRERAL